MNLQELDLAGLIELAKSGNPSALEKLSLTALGEAGDALLARAAILEIDSLPWPPVTPTPQAPKSIVWPKEV